MCIGGIDCHGCKVNERTLLILLISWAKIASFSLLEIYFTFFMAMIAALCKHFDVKACVFLLSVLIFF